MMSWNGESGSIGYEMTNEESVVSMARLSLMGKLNLAILETNTWCPGWYGLVSYYEWSPEIPIEKFLPQISVQSFAAQCGTLPERELSILLKMIQEKRLI